MEEKALSEIEFWKLVAMAAIFLLQVLIGLFGKNYFNRLDLKMDRVENKIDSIEKDHHETKSQVREHSIRIGALEKA